MSGGSYNYEYCRVEEEYVGRMLDPEMDMLMADLVKVLRAVEWYVSADTCEDAYRKAVAEFKRKWLSGDQRVERLDEIITQKCEELKKQLMAMIDGRERR